MTTTNQIDMEGIYRIYAEAFDRDTTRNVDWELFEESAGATLGADSQELLHLTNTGDEAGVDLDTSL